MPLISMPLISMTRKYSRRILICTIVFAFALTIFTLRRPIQRWYVRQLNHDLSHTDIQEDLRQAQNISLSVWNFHDTEKKFPFSPKRPDWYHPDISWRALAAPYTLQHSHYDQYDTRKAWNAPENKDLFGIYEPSFRLSSGKVLSAIRDIVDRKSDLLDSHLQTIMLIENPNISIDNWTQPNDPDIDQAVDFVMNIKSGDSLIALTYGNTAVRIQSPALTGATREQIRAAFDPKDGIDIDLNILD